jgi:site-specific DNA-methyltransferase (adenine-specific)
MTATKNFLELNKTHLGDARKLIPRIQPDSIALSFWSPPYHVGKDYEKGQTYEDWKALLNDVIKVHYEATKPGGFLVINIGDILVFPDSEMPKYQALNPSLQRYKLSRDDIIAVKEKHPSWNRYKLAEHFGVSEQTIDRRLNGNNIRGGKHETQTKVKLVGGLIEEFGSNAGFYLYDRRIWVKDPAWANSQWHNSSYRSVDESEYLYIFWKPGITKIDRRKLTKKEWGAWGSRGVWHIPSVRVNDDHEAKFPLELALRVVRLFSNQNEIVLDCFMGSGTTGIAAIKLGRRFIGIDKESIYVKLSNKAFNREFRSIGKIEKAVENIEEEIYQQKLL